MFRIALCHRLRLIRLAVDLAPSSVGRVPASPGVIVLRLWLLRYRCGIDASHGRALDAGTGALPSCVR